MISNRSTLLSRIEVAEETMAFHFERPRGFLFKAGQYIDLTLLGPQPGSANAPDSYLLHCKLTVRRGPCSHDPHARYSVQACPLRSAHRF